MLTIPRPKGERSNAVMGAGEWLARNRRVVSFYGAIQLSEYTAELCDALVVLDELSNEPIKIVIHSPGGYVETALTIYDIIKSLKCPVYTYTRQSASAAVLLTMAGTPGHRYVFPNTKIMIHQPSANFASVTAEESRKRSKQLNDCMKQIAQLMIDDGCTRSMRTLIHDMKEETWLDAQQAIDYGIADVVAEGFTW